MMKNGIKQNAKGENIVQNIIINKESSVVDICAKDIEIMLDKLSSIASQSLQDPKIIPPDIERKNQLNNIDSANAIEINRSYAHFDIIKEAISSDHTDNLQNKYFQSVYLLQQMYLSKYQGNLPAFKTDVVAKYHDAIDDSTPTEAIKLFHLLNYMYLNCHIGVTP